MNVCQCFHQPSRSIWSVNPTKSCREDKIAVNNKQLLLNWYERIAHTAKFATDNKVFPILVVDA